MFTGKENKKNDWLLEKLSAIEHARWSHWQKYLYSQSVPQDDGSLLIPAELVKKWNKQAYTEYDDLSEREKMSDREQVMKYLPLIYSVFGANQKEGTCPM